MVAEQYLLQYHDQLNPVLWDEDFSLKKPIETKLLDTTMKWLSLAQIPMKDVQDIVMTGGNANYNYTDQSDIDIHVLVDRAMLGHELHVSDINGYLQHMKSLYKNKDFVSRYPIELYAMDAREPFPRGEGVYSILHHHWIQAPSWSASIAEITSRPTFQVKLNSFRDQIDHLIAINAPTSQFEALRDKLRIMRNVALSHQGGGEFSIENLIFKELRNEGYLDKMDVYLHPVIAQG